MEVKVKVYMQHQVLPIFVQNLWSSGRALGSQLEGCGFDPRPMLDGSGVKAMQGLIPAPNSGPL